MNYWLMKSEPEDFSIDDLARKDFEGWNGVRNYQARNFMRDDMALEDLILFYHSKSAQPSIVGIARVVKTAYPDPSQFDPTSKYFDPKATVSKPRWYQVDIAFVEKYSKPISLKHLKSITPLQDMVLITHPRLSISPVSPEQWQLISQLAQT